MYNKRYRIPFVLPRRCSTLQMFVEGSYFSLWGHSKDESSLLESSGLFLLESTSFYDRYLFTYIHDVYMNTYICIIYTFSKILQVHISFKFWLYLCIHIFYDLSLMNLHIFIYIHIIKVHKWNQNGTDLPAKDKEMTQRVNQSQLRTRIRA